MPSILLLTNRVPYPLRDGGALAMDAMIRGYRAKGWQVHLLSMNTTRHPVPASILGTLFSDLQSFRTVDINTTIYPFHILKNLLLSRGPEHADRFRSAPFARALEETILDKRPDVIQLESPFFAGYLPAVRKVLPGAIVVYRMHNVEHQIWKRLSGESSGLKRMYLRILSRRMRKFERRLWTMVDLILPITETDAAVVARSGKAAPVEVAPFGIVPTDQPPALPRPPFRVYHIGAMDWQPNRDGVQWFLREVWPTVKERCPEVTFHFAGRRMPTDLFRDLPEGAFCEGEVDDAGAFAADKHILVVPLFSGGGIRVKILEAFSAGKFVVSTTIGMQGIDAVDQRDYDKADTAEQFIYAIGWASTHYDKVKTYSWFAQKLVREKYDAREIMGRVDARLRKLLGDQPNAITPPNTPI